MADVTIKYSGSQIAELNGTGSKTMQTSGKYCAGDIAVEYAPRSKTYEITLAKASGWVLLTALDADVLEHINDASLVVMFANVDSYEFLGYSVSMAIAGNTQIAQQGSYPVYGVIQRQAGETSNATGAIYYPANKSDSSITLGVGMFRVDGNKYYIRPWDGFVRTGTYRLTFTW